MRRPIVLFGLLLIAILALMVFKNELTQPPPLRTQAAAGEFDATRAKARLAAILGDQRPHPADTPGDDAVRGRIVAQLQTLGLQPIVRDQLACNELYKQRGVSCARVRNVIAAIGPSAGKAVLLNAHYDSTPVGPGAADDGIGVATLLEVGAILKNEPLRRPVILLFNEGEELGLVGARAFLSDPLSAQVDTLINLEARGVRGPVNMFETSRPHAAPIAMYAAAVRNPVANSLSTDVYRLMPNYTDVNTLQERHWTTLNLAPIGNETRYHSAGDDVAALDPATLQHMGDQTLALARTAANAPPRAGGGDRIFMDIAGKALFVLPLLLAAILLIGLLVSFCALVLARGGLARSFSVVVGSIAGSTALSWLALAAIGGVRHGMFWRAQPVWTLTAAYASILLVATLLLGTIGRAATVRQLRGVFWLAYLLIGGLIGLAAPGGMVFFLLPPLIVLVGALGGRWWRYSEQVAAVIALIILYFTWGAMLGLLEELLNSGPMWIFAALGSLVILPIMIEAKALLDVVRWRLAGLVAGGLALLVWVGAAAAPAYSADREQRFALQHVTDASSGRASWSVLNDGAPLPAAFRRAASWSRGTLRFSDRSRWIARAAADAGAKAPTAELLSEVRNGDERTLVLRLHANGSERLELIAPDNARVRSAGIGAFVRPIDQGESGRYDLSCYGRACDGAVVELTIGQPKPAEFLLLGGRADLPTTAAPFSAARPRFSRPQYNRDERIIFTRMKL